MLRLYLSMFTIFLYSTPKTVFLQDFAPSNRVECFCIERSTFISTSKYNWNQILSYHMLTCNKHWYVRGKSRYSGVIIPFKPRVRNCMSRDFLYFRCFFEKKAMLPVQETLTSSFINFFYFFFASDLHC